MSDLTLSVLLGASITSGFNRVFGSAGKSVGKLGASIKQTHAQLNDVRAYQRNDAALDVMRSKLGETQHKVMDLRRALAADPDSATLANKLEKARNQAVKLSATLEAQRGKLRQEGEALRRAGIDTRDLNTANERLTRTLEKQKAALAANGALLQKRHAAMADMRTNALKLGATVVSGALIMRPLLGAAKDAAEFDKEMQNIGNTADMTAAQIAALKQSIFEASKQTGRGIGDVQAGIGFLVAAGLDVGRAQQSIVAIGRTATAESANIEDLSKASFTLIDSMGVKPTALADALDILTQSGKEGNVELRDMAAQLPTLGAQFKGLKMQGRDAVATLGAALEIARKGAADPAEAANNMRNFMAKVLSPATLQKAKQNFGLDLYKIIQDAQKSGGNPFEASVKAIMHATDGDAKKMGELFTDMQVQNFLRPLMQNWSEYQRIKAKALDSHGVVDRDFERMRKTSSQQMAQLGQAWERFKLNAGAGMAAAFGKLATVLTPVLNKLSDFAAAHPKLVGDLGLLAGAVLTATTALIGMKLAMAGGSWLLSFGGGIGSLGGIVRGIVPALGIARGAIMGMTLAMRAFSLSLLANPVGLVIGAIVGAIVVGALVIRKYWEPIKAFFKGVWQGISEAAGPVLGEIGAALAPLKPLWDGFVSVLSTVWHWFATLLEPVHSTKEQLDHATSAGKVFGEALVGAFKMIIWPIRLGLKLGQMFGQALGTAAGWVVVKWEGLKDKITAVIGWIAKKIEWLVNKWKTVKHVIGGVWSGTKGVVGSVWNTVTHPLGDGARAPVPRAAAAAMMATAVASSPAMARGAATPVVVQGGTTTIQVHAAPGMDERALARNVREQLAEHQRQQDARTRSKLGDLD